MTRTPVPPELEEEPLDAASEAALALALRSAFSPSSLDRGKNERLIELALEDPLAPPSIEEQIESDRLRRALDGELDHPDLALARALKAASGKSEPAPALPDPARLTDPTDVRRGNIVSMRPRSAKVFAWVGAAATITALAASVMLVLRPADDRSAAKSTESTALSRPVELAETRSSQELFDEKFAVGETSSRVDRIAQVRARELRENRYALWGVP